MLVPNLSWSSCVLKSKYFHGSRLRCLDGEPVIKKGSPIAKIYRKALPFFTPGLHWIPGNGKRIRIWYDIIQGQIPPKLPRLQNWMTAQGINTLWDISDWENEESASWVAWKLPECPEELKNEKRMLFSHLSGLAPLGKNIKDKRGWGMSSGNYTAAEGYQKFSTNYNVPGNP